MSTSPLPPRPDRRYRLVVAREQYKFSCAHMTVFPDGSKERLHGHNYQLTLALELRDVSFAAMVPFSDLKDVLAALCTAWKERVLLADRNPHFELVRDDGHEVEFRLCGERYVLPAGDVLRLPLDNIAVEPLAAHVADHVAAAAAAVLAQPHVLGYEVGVYEQPGQGATCVVALR
ncbi:MAG: 6-carboxytetrahydropterin synthase [Kofleriaceae bacterium]|jgi:6-pyruvoyltetrahydropterin/6-carboxytetrahydropterin synthase|nr:6-carboxytetrahydropterin synthase [Kofleriaceae bacterium]MBP6835994.1 6-carboxytetrahydropterin synthase [Kofleriaceae bacterium]MBP9203521.1 6-carboxytetrahydropterin synthase [Kofleriaceae bacterium]